MTLLQFKKKLSKQQDRVTWTGHTFVLIAKLFQLYNCYWGILGIGVFYIFQIK